MKPKKIDIFNISFLAIFGIMIILSSLHLAVAYDQAHSSNKFDAPKFFKQFTERIENDPFKIEQSKSTTKFLFFGILAYFLYILYRATTKRKLIEGKEYGTAEWGKTKEIRHFFSEVQKNKKIKNIKKMRLNDKQEREEIEKINEEFFQADMLLSQTEKICIHSKGINNNTLVIGGSGAGKTRSFVVPNILQTHSSYIITDPKGEILEKTGNFLKQNGYEIRILNLEEKSRSNRYNPFHYIHPERNGWEERTMSLIETIILNTDDGEKKSSSDPFWDRAEKLFLQAIFLLTVSHYEKKDQNMNTVLNLIGMLQIKDDNDKNDSALDKFFKDFAKEKGENHIAFVQYQEFRTKAAGKTAKSIVITAVARLSMFRTAEIQDIFQVDEMMLDQVGERKTAIFVIIPPVDSTFNFIAGMLFTQLFQELNYCALTVHKKTGRLPVPCRFILDEFANTCKIPNFLKILAYARSLGIGIAIIVQSLEQLKKMYEKDWGVLVDNTNTILYLGKISHMETLEYFSKLLGKGTFDKKTRGKSLGKQSSSSINEDRLGREILDASEIRKIKDDECLVFIAGHNAFFSKKYKYERHPNYKWTSDANKKYSFEADMRTKFSIKEPEKETDLDEAKKNAEKSFKEIKKTSDELVQKVDFDQEKVARQLKNTAMILSFDQQDVAIIIEEDQKATKNVMDLYAVIAKNVRTQKEKVSFDQEENIQHLEQKKEVLQFDRQLLHILETESENQKSVIGIYRKISISLHEVDLEEIEQLSQCSF